MIILGLRLIGKRVRDFLLVLIELFSLGINQSINKFIAGNKAHKHTDTQSNRKTDTRCGITAEALRAITGSKSAISLQRGPVDPKFRVEGVVSTNHSSS